MATMAFYDGRKSGRLGALISQNPYTEDPQRQEWIRGYSEGTWYHRADTQALMMALLHLEDLVGELQKLP